MAALTSAAITVTKVSSGGGAGLNIAVGLLTLTGDASGTANGSTGITMPTGWRGPLGVANNLQYVAPFVLQVTATPDIAYLATIDVANDKLILIGGASTAAEDKPFEALPTSHTPAAAAYAGKFIAMGF